MGIYSPLFNDRVHLTMSVGTDTGVKGYVLLIDDVGGYVIPQHILDVAKANDHYEDYSDEKKQQYILNLMLQFVEDSSFKK